MLGAAYNLGAYFGDLSSGDAQRRGVFGDDNVTPDDPSTGYTGLFWIYIGLFLGHIDTHSAAESSETTMSHPTIHPQVIQGSFEYI